MKAVANYNDPLLLPVFFRLHVHVERFVHEGVTHERVVLEEREARPRASRKYDTKFLFDKPVRVARTIVNTEILVREAGDHLAAELNHQVFSTDFFLFDVELLLEALRVISPRATVGRRLRFDAYTAIRSLQLPETRAKLGQPRAADMFIGI